LKVNFRQRHREFLFKNADIVLEISIELEDMVDLSRLLKSALVKRKKKEEMRERARETEKTRKEKRRKGNTTYLAFTTVPRHRGPF